MSRWIVKLRGGINNRREVRRIATWAARVQDPVARLRYLRQRTAALPAGWLEPRRRFWWKRVATVGGAAVVLAAMMLLWQRI